MCISLECKKYENICGEVCYHPELKVRVYSLVSYVMKNYTFTNRCVNQPSLVIGGREVEGSASFDILKIKALIRVLELFKIRYGCLSSVQG